jgi:hypothetical protein
MQRQFAATAPIQTIPREAFSHRLGCAMFLEQTLQGFFLQGSAATFHERGIFAGIPGPRVGAHFLSPPSHRGHHVGLSMMRKMLA